MVKSTHYDKYRKRYRTTEQLYDINCPIKRIVTEDGMNCPRCNAELPGESKYCNLCGKKLVREQNKRTRGNGEGTVYQLPGGKWRAEITLGWRQGNRLVKTKSGFKTKKEALAALELIKQSPIDVNPNIKFCDIYDLWSESHYKNISKPTADGYRKAYQYAEPLHYFVFSQIKTADLQKVIDNASYEKNGKARSAGYRTKADIQSLFTNLFKYAIENDYVQKNYAEFVKLPPKPKTKKDAFTQQEIDALWRDYEAGNEFTGYILIMIYTGLRYGEISTIKKENVHIPERYMIGGIKTAAGIDRVIPIADYLYPIVAKFYLAGDKKILEMHEKVFYNTFYETLKRAGVRKLNPHCCRHTFATLMANKGIQPAVITETAGHEDYSTTLQYTHISLDEKLKAVNSLK